jgi:hypothetical protein
LKFPQFLHRADEVAGTDEAQMARGADAETDLSNESGTDAILLLNDELRSLTLNTESAQLVTPKPHGPEDLGGKRERP